ncbi:MAG TPA: hypothetical protein PLU22_00050 [Polyangiaceae bacterium]|nr:hypothetical protein [Polyangiaceae bacterium]
MRSADPRSRVTAGLGWRGALALGALAGAAALGVGWYATARARSSGRAPASSAAAAGERGAGVGAARRAVAAGRAGLADGSGEPAASLSALGAVESAYVAQGPGDAPFDPALDREVIRALDSEHPAVVARALAAARLPMVAGRPGEELLAAVLRLAASDQPPARRQAALQALGSLRPSQRSPAWLERFEAALRAPEPQVIATALEVLLGSPRAWQERAELRARWVPLVTGLVGHPDPGIRGRALGLLGALDGAAARALARAALRDPHPFVRAVGCDVLGQTDEAAYIHDLMPLVEDRAEARYDLVGFTSLDGQPGSVPHAVPGRRRVAEAALFAVETLADGAVRLPFGGREGADERLELSIQSARAWYARERARLPAPLP